MPAHILFVDTETSGLPTDWRQPYAEPGAWPHVAQIAWLVYTAAGELVHTENHYIRPTDYDLTPESRRVHGLTLAFLHEHGEGRREVMQLLHDDLLRYKPLVVGHFIELDYHMMGVSFHRAGLSNPLPGLPTFCTMRLTERFWQPMRQQYLRLAELYQRQFGQPLLRQHDALADAEATAQCFFALERTGDITAAVLESQPLLSPPPTHARLAGPSRWKQWLGLA